MQGSSYLSEMATTGRSLMKKGLSFANPPSRTSSCEEARGLCWLAIPTIIIQMSFVAPHFLSASYIGRKFGYLHLDGFTLAWGAGNLSTLALLQGIFNACDTLGPRAFGAEQYREVGLVAVRGFVTSLLVILPVNTFISLSLEHILKALGQDAEATEHACQFYLALSVSFPFYAFYEILWRFLSAQNLFAPMVIASLLGNLIVLPISLSFFMHIFGFVGAAAALSFSYGVQSGLVIAWLVWKKPHHPETWPGLRAACQDALATKPFCFFLALSTGGTLAYLEWIYWEVLTVIIGTFGVMPLSAHIVPKQFTEMADIVPLGTSIALSIRLGVTLPRSLSNARTLTFNTFVFSLVTFGFAAVAMFAYRDWVIAIFTSEPTIVKNCHEIWFHACLYFYLFCMFGITNGIAIGLGMQWTMGFVTFICMWVIGMPLTYYCAVIKGGGLRAVWACIWPPYVLINAIMCVTFWGKDWDLISKQIKLGGEKEKMDADEIEAILPTTSSASHEEDDINYRRKS